MKDKNEKMNIAAIIPAGGTGDRFGGNIPKQFVNLDGIPVIIRTLLVFEITPDITSIVVSVLPQYKNKLEAYIRDYNLSKVTDLVDGGKERHFSVMNAMNTKAVLNSDIVLIHDAVRPFASPLLVQEIIEATKIFGAAIPGLTPKETIKVVNEENFIQGTIARDSLVSVQTPQGFKTEIIYQAYKSLENNAPSITDDATLVENLGYNVHVIPGEEFNIKITSKPDFWLSEVLAKVRYY